MRLMSKEIVERMIAILEEIGEGNKSGGEVAFAHGVDPRVLSRDMKDFKELVGFWSAKIKLIDEKGLLEGTSRKEMKEKQRQTKIAKAKVGYYFGISKYGLLYRDGNLFPNENYENRKKIIAGFLAGKSKAELAKDYNLSTIQVSDIITDPVNKGEWKRWGQTFQGQWEPLITPDVFNQIKARIGPTGAPLIYGYRWLNGRRVLKPGAKKKYAKIFKLRIKKNMSLEKIAQKVDLSRHQVMDFVRDRRITGEIEVDGKLVDSGYEPAIDGELWKEAQGITAPAWGEQLAKRAKTNRRKIMRYLHENQGAYSWELEEKMKFSKSHIHDYMKALVKEGSVKRREDYLFQIAWEPYPEMRVEKNFKTLSLRRRKILSVLFSERRCLTKSELAHETGFSWQLVRFTVNGLLAEGFLEIDHKGYGGKIRLSEIGSVMMERTRP